MAKSAKKKPWRALQGFYLGVHKTPLGLSASVLTYEGRVWLVNVRLIKYLLHVPIGHLVLIERNKAAVTPGRTGEGQFVVYYDDRIAIPNMEPARRKRTR